MPKRRKLKCRKFLYIHFPENFLFKRARRVLLIAKISGWVTEQTFEIKGNVSSKVYFGFSQFFAAFLFPVSCARFTFIRKQRYDFCLRLSHAIFTIARATRVTENRIECVRSGHVGRETQYDDVPLGNKFHFHANIFLLFYSFNTAAANKLYTISTI